MQKIKNLLNNEKNLIIDRTVWNVFIRRFRNDFIQRDEIDIFEFENSSINLILYLNSLSIFITNPPIKFRFDYSNND
jgi:hypothetical protein